MMQSYDKDFLRDIDDNVDLLDYVIQDIPMEKHGKDYFGHCPLHIDNTASFSITPDKNSFYCFSCGRYGGIIAYLREYEHLSFHQAVQKAASLANIDVSSACKSRTISELKVIRDTLKKKPDNPEHPIIDYDLYDKYVRRPAKEWLDEGISEEVQDIFGVRIDTWQNRIVYPVYDISGNLINIKGRTMYGNFKDLKIAKYINYYKVGVMDYFQSLNMALPHVKQTGEIIIFESIKSVMKMYGWGFKNCASAEKHTLTNEQISLLVKLRCDIVFAYDSDISYEQKDVKTNLDKLKRITNVYVIEDKNNLLGGVEAKNSPADLTKEIWEELYNNKRKLI